jgi:hypothetical protein
MIEGKRKSVWSAVTCHRFGPWRPDAHASALFNLYPSAFLPRSAATGRSGPKRRQPGSTARQPRWGGRVGRTPKRFEE